MPRKKKSNRKGPKSGDSGLSLGPLGGIEELLSSMSPEEIQELVEMIPGEMGLDAVVELPPNYEKARELLELIDYHESPELASEAAKKAVELCPQCMEAFLRLAELESSSEKVVALYRNASEAGQWMIHANSNSIQCNPVLLAYAVYKIQMSDHLWGFGQRVEAVEHLTDVKNLDPDDSLDIVVRLGFRLLDLGWDDELNELLESAGDRDGDAGYALLIAIRWYRDLGESAEASALLRIASDLNPTLIDYLLGDMIAPDEIEDAETREEEEAIALSQVVMPLLKNLSGLTRWMRDALDYRRPERLPSASERRSELDGLLQLPMTEDTWVVDCRELADSWILLIFSQESQEIIQLESFEERPTWGEAWDVFLDSLETSNEEPCRPSKVALTRKSWMKSWTKKCKQLEIDCEVVDRDSIPASVLEEFEAILSRVDVDIELSDDVFDEIRELDAYDKTWLVGAFEPPLWITDGATPRRPWIVLVMDEESGFVLMQEMGDAYSDALLKQAVLKAMLQPLAGEAPPHRPSGIKIHHRTHSQEFLDLLDRIDVEHSDMDQEEGATLEDCMESLIRQVSGPESKSLLDAEGVTEQNLAQLFQSVARFWKIAPWRTIPGDRPIEIQSQAFGGKIWYVVIVGQLGMNLGMVLYDQKKAMDAVMQPDARDSEPDGVFLNYLEKFEIPAVDLWHQEKYGWPIAAEEAYPLIERALPNMKHRRPDQGELMALDVALRALPAFLSRPESKEAFSLSVNSFDQRVEVEVRWV